MNHRTRETLKGLGKTAAILGMLYGAGWGGCKHLNNVAEREIEQRKQYKKLAKKVEDDGPLSWELDGTGYEASISEHNRTVKDGDGNLREKHYHDDLEIRVINPDGESIVFLDHDINGMFPVSTGAYSRYNSLKNERNRHDWADSLWFKNNWEDRVKIYNPDGELLTSYELDDMKKRNRKLFDRLYDEAVNSRELSIEREAEMRDAKQEAFRAEQRQEYLESITPTPEEQAKFDEERKKQKAERKRKDQEARTIIKNIR